MVCCYMVVSPNPYTTVSASYYVKFGDGSAANVYHRANPNYAYVENHLSPAQTLNAVTYDTSTIARQPGKWLEWIHIKITGGARVYNGSEWHTVQVKSNQNSQTLRNNLCNMLNLFPRWNRWSETGSSDQSTVNFENLVDRTWYCCSAEAIAWFRS